MILIAVWVSPSTLYVITTVFTMINITWVTFLAILQRRWRMDAWSDNLRGLVEEDPVANFVVLPNYNEDDRPHPIAEETSSQRDRLGWPRVVFSTIQTWSRAVRTWKSGFSCLLYPPVSCSLSSCRLRDAMKVGNIRPQKIVSPYTTRSTCLSGLQTFRVPSSSFLDSDRAEKIRRCFSQYPDRACQDVGVVTSG